MKLQGRLNEGEGERAEVLGNPLGRGGRSRNHGGARAGPHGGHNRTWSPPGRPWHTCLLYTSPSPRD
eukprot:14396510-Alexandrium_andersonii.AAC.1